MILQPQYTGGTGVGMPNMIGELNQFYQSCVAPEVLESFYCTTFVGAVTTKQRLQSLLDNNLLEYTYTRLSRPTVHGGVVLENTDYKSPELPTGTQCKIRLGYYAYTNEKLPKETLKFMTGNSANIYTANRNMQFGMELGQKHQADFMCWLAGQVHPCNEGKTAGVISGGIDLGDFESPYVMNPRNANALSVLGFQALDEHKLPHSDRAMIIPTAVKTQMALSVGLAIANQGRGASEYMNGMCPENLQVSCGRQVFEQNCMMPQKNAAGQLVYPVYFLWTKALDGAYGMDRERSGVFLAENGSRAAPYYNEVQFMRYGFANVYCQGVARAWVTIDPNWQDKLPGGACA